MILEIFQSILLDPHGIIVFLGSNHLRNLLVTAIIILRVFFIFAILQDNFFKDVSKNAWDTVHEVFTVYGLLFHNGQLWLFVALDIV